jgi:tetratricopeptide (TPR) repeat protein
MEKSAISLSHNKQDNFSFRQSIYFIQIMHKIKQILTIVFLFSLLLTGITTLAQEEVKSYESVIKSANTKFAEKDYISAKTYYEMALRFNAEDTYAKNRLAETLVLLKKQMEVQELFYQHLDLADRLLGENKPEEALAEYNEALKVFPNDKYALSKAAKISETLNTERQKIDNYNKALSLGQKLLGEQKYEEAIFQLNEANTLIPNQKAVTEDLATANKMLAAQKITQENFNKFKLEADQFITRREYQKAIEKLNQALLLIPDDAKTQAQLAEVSQLNEKSMRYNALLAEADNLYGEKMLEEARVQYDLALQAWPEQSYPADMIKRIDQTLSSEAFVKNENFNKMIASANQLYANKSYEPALAEYIKANAIKPEDDFVKQRISEIDGIMLAQKQMIETNARYAKLISEAKTNYDAKQFEPALSAYREAAILKPEEVEPTAKIKEIETLLSDLKASEALQNKYDALIKSADELFAASQFPEAKTNYTEAASLMKDQAYPLAQVNKIDKLLAENARINVIETQYAALIATADLAFNEKKWPEAIDAYTEAQKVKPEEQYPGNQIKLAQETRSQIEKENALATQYNDAITLADNHLANEKFNEAIASYQTALTFKPNESYPQTQINFINEKVKQLNDAKVLEIKLNELKSLAESEFTNKNYENAIVPLNQMLGLDPTNTYATAKIAEIRLIQEANARENQRMYDESIAVANKNMDNKEYNQAITDFKTALNYRPNDPYATEKITQIDNILREKLLLLKTEYNRLVTEADRQFNTKTYDKAVEFYLQAEIAKSDETYPREQIKKISKIIEDNKLFELNSANLILTSNTAKRFEFKPVDVIERRGNYILVKARNTGTKSFPLLVSFGSKSGKNGGFVLPIPENGEFNDFIVRIGSQYKWFSEDNTWIEVYPENGEVEVGLMQISKSE